MRCQLFMCSCRAILTQFHHKLRWRPVTSYGANLNSCLLDFGVEYINVTVILQIICQASANTKMETHTYANIDIHLSRPERRIFALVNQAIIGIDYKNPLHWWCHNPLLMTSQFTDNCEATHASKWKVISNSHIDFIHAIFTTGRVRTLITKQLLLVTAPNFTYVELKHTDIILYSDNYILMVKISVKFENIWMDVQKTFSGRTKIFLNR